MTLTNASRTEGRLGRSDGASPRGPLDGVRVLELGTLIAGPFTGRLLGDFGADIVKVEAPSRGDPLRQWGAEGYHGQSLWWAVQSRNKRLITLDLRTERGQELCRRLATESDVLLENFRPGTMERWSLGPAELLELNPRLVYARVSGYGQTGPYAPRAGFASAGEAMGGLRYLNGYPHEPPPRSGVSLGDSLAGMFAALGIVMALYHRDGRGGRGQVVDASIMESCFAMLESVVPEYDHLGMVRERGGTTLSNAAPSNIYRSRDNRWIVIAANSDNLFDRLCSVMDREDLCQEERFADHRSRGENRDELDAIIGDWASQRDATEIDAVLNDNGVVCSPVYSVAEMFEDPHFRARELILRLEDPELGEIAAPGIVPKLSATPGHADTAGSWETGAANLTVYRDWMGLTDDEIAGLATDGVI
ncbi:MAG TPA: CoA transferase [Solirubrobacteraceae bacterium]|jgi:crotonobetainyl-CoA:carnitine CoA-transferase CaiB-like acyl-CoA transferase